jgi:hypothetical protein
MFYVYVGLVQMSIALSNIRLTALTTRLWKNINLVLFVMCTAYNIAALPLDVSKCPPSTRVSTSSELSIGLIAFIASVMALVSQYTL